MREESELIGMAQYCPVSAMRTPHVARGAEIASESFTEINYGTEKAAILNAD